jgi:hypothetical protein
MRGPQSDDQPWHADLRPYQIDPEPKGISAPSPCFMHQRHRKAILNRGMVPNINPNPRNRQSIKRGRKPIFRRGCRGSHPGCR